MTAAALFVFVVVMVVSATALFAMFVVMLVLVFMVITAAALFAMVVMMFVFVMMSATALFIMVVMVMLVIMVMMSATYGANFLFFKFLQLACKRLSIGHCVENLLTIYLFPRRSDNYGFLV